MSTSAPAHVPAAAPVPPLYAQPPPPLPPTVATLTAFLASFFPLKPKDVPFRYHIPRSPGVESTPAPRLVRCVLSITPTRGVYEALHRGSDSPPLAFLHRPFGLDRWKVPRGSTVLSSHVGFDEVLTTGWNTALASRLGIDVADSVCLQGYKGDPERRIGLVGGVDSSLEDLIGTISHEFRCSPEVHGVSDDEIVSQRITAVAIMNAFHPDEVNRVMEAAHKKGWLPYGPTDGSTVLYLTGQPREAGLAATREKGMKVICVGHRECEQWGISYLASRVRSEFPMIEVEEIHEEEEKTIRPQRQSKGPTNAPPAIRGPSV